jgi:hypothetical protein
MSESNLIKSNKEELFPKENILIEGKEPVIKKIKPLIDSLDLYLINVLKNPIKKLDTRDTLISKLAKNPRLSEDSIKELISLEKNKYFFTTLRNLLRFSESIVGFPSLKDSLRGYLRESLCRNEIIVNLSLEASVLNLENSLPLDVCIKKILLIPQAELTDEYFKQIKPKDWRNYVSTIALVFAEWCTKARGMSPSQLVELLNNSLWSNSLKKRDHEAVIKNLLDSTNFELIASVTAFYQQKYFEATNKLLKKEDQMEKILLIKNEFEAKLTDKGIEINQLQFDFAELNIKHKEALNNCKVEIETISINLKNQLEDLRIRNLRLLQSSIDLLTDGLTALGRTEPKINVMKDYAERVLKATTEELGHLKEIGK